MKQVHLLVSGRVQGVCYRHCSAKKARELGLRGFVKNLANGKVEILIEGESDKVEAFVGFCKNNPSYANIEDVEVIEEKEVKASGLNDFEIRR